jgi:hypothetical protein
VTAAELDQALRAHGSRVGADAAPVAPLVSQREQFAALERHRAAQRFQWVCGGLVAALGVWWLHSRVSKLEAACEAMHASAPPAFPPEASAP